MTTVDIPVTEPTLRPPPGALVDAAQDPPLFVMFSTDWLRLQSYIAATLKLPITQTDFESTYGTFSDESEVEDVVNAMKAVQAMSSTFGDPTSLMESLSKDPAILETSTPPEQLYVHIVWTAMQVYHAASTFNETLGQFMNLLDPSNCGSLAECGEVLAQVLTGEGGLQSTAQTAESIVNGLVQALATFATAMEQPNQQIANYASKSGQFYQDAVAAAGQDARDVQSFQADADTAYQQWENYTIAAVTVSIGITIISGGMLWPAAAAAAGVLGHDATEARDNYNNYCAERDAASEDEQKKQQLIADLGGLGTQVANVNKAIQSFIQTLTEVAGAWAQIGSDLDDIVTNYTPEKLGQYSWVNQALKCEDATKDWRIIATAARAYTTDSLVPFDLSVNFGQPLPAS